MAAIFHTFSNAFFFMKTYQISLKFVPKGPINNILVLVQTMAWCRLWQYSSIGSGNGLALTRHQAIIWSNDGQFTDAYMRHWAWMS